ncbi:uncharacterized protein LOC143029949 [Oratosquilla oratoria]|uniref:uncharacterized protein LOC143029949 n=1 Tax=Oratosquilla oratoria TaxID=337810 RepID=UPI003F76F16F
MCNTQSSVGEKTPSVGAPVDNSPLGSQVERPQQQRKAHSRRVNKPLMERKRRERINSCLEELKTLVLKAQSKDPSRYSKLEKADILEMTVRHVQSLHHHDPSRSSSSNENAGKYRAGFSQCAAEVTRFLAGVKGMPHDVHVRLLQHIQAVASQSTRAPGSSATLCLPKMSIQQMTSEPVTVTTVMIPEDTKTSEKNSAMKTETSTVKSRRPMESPQCSKKRIVATPSYVVPQSPPKSPPNSVPPTLSNQSQIVHYSLSSTQPLKGFLSRQILPTTSTSSSSNEHFIHNPKPRLSPIAGSPPPLVTPVLQKTALVHTRMTSGELALLASPESSTPPGMVTPPGSPNGATSSPEHSRTNNYQVLPKAGSYCKEYVRSEHEGPKIQRPSCSLNSLGYHYPPYSSQAQWHRANTHQPRTPPRRPIPASTTTSHWRPW